MDKFVIDRETGEIQEQRDFRINGDQWEDCFQEDTDYVSHPWKLEVEEKFWKGSGEKISDFLTDIEKTEGVHEAASEKSREKEIGEVENFDCRRKDAGRTFLSKRPILKGDTLGGRPAQRENLDGGFRLCLQEQWPIPQYLKKIMEQNLCSDFLHMSFLQFGEVQRIYYDCSGYLQLGEYLKQWRGTPQDFSAEAFRILSEISRCLLRAENHLVRTGDLVLAPDTVFVHKEDAFIKLAFCPSGRMRKEENAYDPAPWESFSKIISYMENVCRDSQWPLYGNSLRRELQERNLSVREALRLFRNREADVFSGEWKAENTAQGFVWGNEELLETGFSSNAENPTAESVGDYLKRLKIRLFSRG